MSNMRKNNLISWVGALALVCAIFLNNSILTFAEEESKELSFNSIVEIESYEIEEGYIEAGKEAHVKLTLRNDNIHTNANSMGISFSSQSGMVYPAYGHDNQILVGNLDASDSIVVTIPIVVHSDFVGDYVDFTCYISYVGNERSITNTSTIILPAKGSNSLIATSIGVSAHATVNAKSLLTLSYYNKSSENINNAVLVVDGNVSQDTKRIDLGNVGAGKTYTKDCNLIFTQSGEQNVNISLEYTDINGRDIQIDFGTFNVSVGETNEVGLNEYSDNNGTMLFGRIIAAVAAVAAILLVFYFFVKKK